MCSTGDERKIWKHRGKMRIVNGETGKETERTSRDLEGWGKEGTKEKGKVPKRADSKQQTALGRGKARQSIFPQTQKLLIAFQ